jgi:hypothetical protein
LGMITIICYNQPPWLIYKNSILFAIIDER